MIKYIFLLKIFHKIEDHKNWLWGMPLSTIDWYYQPLKVEQFFKKMKFFNTSYRSFNMNSQIMYLFALC